MLGAGYRELMLTAIVRLVGCEMGGLWLLDAERPMFLRVPVMEFCHKSALGLRESINIYRSERLTLLGFLLARRVPAALLDIWSCGF